MVGRPMRKVFCQGFTRAGLREGKKIPCRMKGYPLSGGRFSNVNIMAIKTMISLTKLTTQMRVE